MVARWTLTTPAADIAYQPLMVLTVILLVVMLVVGQVAIAVSDPAEAGERDERDRLIDLRGGNLGGYVLAVGSSWPWCSRWPESSSSTSPTSFCSGGCCRAQLRGHQDRAVPTGPRVMTRPTRVTNRIRILRFQSGEMTQADLAAQVGVTRQTIIAIEQGKYSPSLEAAFRIARALDAPLDEVFGFDD